MNLNLVGMNRLAALITFPCLEIEVILVMRADDITIEHHPESHGAILMGADLIDGPDFAIMETEQNASAGHLDAFRHMLANFFHSTDTFEVLFPKILFVHLLLLRIVLLSF